MQRVFPIPDFAWDDFFKKFLTLQFTPFLTQMINRRYVNQTGKRKCISLIRSFICLLVCGLFSVNVGAFAEVVKSRDGSMTDNEAVTDSLNSKFTMLDEVSVLSVKQGADLFSQPVSATLLTGAQLEQLDVLTIKSISDVVPNFFIPDYGSRITSSIYVRGIGARMDQPSVGLTVDNVPFLNKDAYDFDINDMASVEVLRGPQSTLYGRNTMAGIINITTLSPMRYQGWRIFAEAGNGDTFRGDIGYYHKFSERLASSLVVTAAYSDGFFRNEFNGKKVDTDRFFSARWKTDWRLGDNLYLKNSLSAGLLRQSGYPYEYLKTGKIEYNDTCFYRRFTLADGLTVNFDRDRLKIVSMTSVQHINDNMTLDQDFLPESYFTLSQKKKETGVTEDFIVKSADASGGYRWLTGFFAFYKHLDMSAPVTFKDAGIAELIESHRNDANPDYPIAWNGREFVLGSDFSIPTYGLALYHESNYRRGDFTFKGGLRVDFESSRLAYRSRCNTSYTIYKMEETGLVPFRDVDVDIDDTGSLRKNFINWMPNISVLYDIKGKMGGNVYATVSKGYKAGGFNTQMFSDVLQQRLMGIMGIGAQYDVDDIIGYKPEYSWNYEVGTHLQNDAHTVSGDVSVFYIDCRDQQLTMFPDGTTTGRIMTNAGKTRSFGAEVSATFSPVDFLTLNATYGYTNARFVRFFNGINDYKGKYLPYYPQNTIFLQSLFTINVNNTQRSKILLDLNMRGAGPIYWNEANTLRQDFYSQFGASVAYERPEWSISLWGKNITSTRFHTFYFLSMGNEFLQRGKPRQVGVTVRVKI